MSRDERSGMDSQRPGLGRLVGDGPATAMGTVVHGGGQPVVVLDRFDVGDASHGVYRSGKCQPAAASLVEVADRPRSAGKLSRAELDELFGRPRCDHPGRRGTGWPSMPQPRRSQARLRAQADAISHLIKRRTATTAGPAGNSGGPCTHTRGPATAAAE